MRINLLKLIQDLLLPILRKKKVVEFLRSMLLEVPKASNEFELLSDDLRYKANADASVISLEHHINREFDVKAKITELDGRPIDFLVTIIGNVDEIRLRSLIDSYKLSGKSYTFKVGEAKYFSEFINHQCEDIKEVWTIKYSDHQCEIVEFVFLTTELLLADNPNEEGSKWIVKTTSSLPVKSDLRIQVGLDYTDSTGKTGHVGNGVILYTNTTETSGYVPIRDTNISNVSFTLYSIYPEKDNYYEYKGEIKQ